MSDILLQEECFAKKSKHAKKKKRKHSDLLDDMDTKSKISDTERQREIAESAISEETLVNGGSKKKKKKKNIEEPCHDSGCNKTVKDVNNMDRILSENINVLTDETENEYFSKKKKKCKKKHSDTIDKADIEHDLLKVEENVSENIKKSKQAVTGFDCQESNSKFRQEPSHKTDNFTSEKKKRRKNKHAKNGNEEDDKTEKDDKTMSGDATLRSCDTKTDISHDQKERKKTKKVKNEAEISANISEFKTGDMTEMTETEGDQAEMKTKKKRKKKHKYDKEIQNCDESMPEHVGEYPTAMDAESSSSNSVKKKKKKEKKSKSDFECDDSVATRDTLTTNETSSGHKKSKNKKKKKKLTETNEEKSSEISEDQTIATKSGVSDGQDNSSKDRVNTCSEGPQAGHSPTPNSFGQWQNASLGDNNRQQKFLRLLGGFKKGGDSKGVFGNLGAKPKGGNLALSHTEEEALTQNLMSSFQKALDYKLNMGKGVGLGFTPPPGEGKKFHVNTHLIKSKKFHD